MIVALKYHKNYDIINKNHISDMIREEFMKELTLREIQLGELEVLKKFAEICDELGLRYFLHAGTLLGTIRHKGFIPWDDDVDVTMPRDDYEKLVDYFLCKGGKIGHYQLMHYKTNKNYIYGIMRLSDDRYYLDYANAKEYGLGLFIDIYPLDGWGNNEEDMIKILKRMRLNNLLIGLAGMDSFKKSPKGIMRTVVKYLVYLYAQWKGAGYFAEKLEKLGKLRSFDEDNYVGITTWNVYGYGERINKDDLQVTTGYFEEYEFKIPKGYDRILRNMYGDYMIPPDEKDRIGHHFYKAYKK